MEIILKERVANLGERNDLVRVKSGYARNFLIPRGLAIVANPSNIKVRNERIRLEDQKIEGLRSRYDEIRKALEGKSIQIGAKAGESGKIFGSVTTIQVADAIKEAHGIEISRKVIVITEDVKEIGSYTANIRLSEEMNFDVNFEVVAE